MGEHFVTLLVFILKMAVFWIVTPCSLVEVTNVSEVLAASIIRAITHRPDDGGSKDL
jgi:hypothetical protein